jgi:hypothetical protein
MIEHTCTDVQAYFTLTIVLHTEYLIQLDILIYIFPCTYYICVNNRRHILNGHSYLKLCTSSTLHCLDTDDVVKSLTNDHFFTNNIQISPRQQTCSFGVRSEDFIGSNHEERGLLGRNDMYFGDSPTLLRNISLPSSGSKNNLSKKTDKLKCPPVSAGSLLDLLFYWKRYISPKRRNVSELHGIATQKCLLFLFLQVFEKVFIVLLPTLCILQYILFAF